MRRDATQRNYDAAPPVVRDPRALTPLDWAALAFTALALLCAPLWAGLFPTPPRLVSEGSFAFLDTLGQSIVLGFAALGFLLLTVREWRKPVMIGAIPGLTIAFLALAFWSALSLVRTGAMFMSLNALAALLASLMVAVCAARLSRDRVGFYALCRTIVCAGLFVSALGIREYAEQWKLGDPYHRVFSSFANPGFLAGYLLLTLPVTFAYFVQTRDRMARLLLGLALAFQSACLLLTGTRAAVGIVILVLLAWTLLSGWSGAAIGRWKQIGLAFGIFVVMTVLASTPTRVRLQASAAPLGQENASAQSFAAASARSSTALESQGHSAEFRKYTWMGALQMAKANPILGRGLGSFEISYPRYAQTAFTAHAHNSFLQLAGEAGFPATLLLLTGVAAVTSFAAFVLTGQREKSKEELQSSEESETELSDSKTPPRLLLAGLLAAILATLIKNNVDSDWYIVATMLTFSALLGLTAGAARDLAPLATQLPRAMPRWMLGVCAAAALFVCWRVASAGLARQAAAQGTAAMYNQEGARALEGFSQAASLDVFDPEPLLDMASINGAIGRKDEALSELRQAIRRAPTGKAYYRLGQFLMRSGDLTGAEDALENARLKEPKNLQNMRVLAEIERKAGHNDRAKMVYEEMIALQKTPFGTVRAMPHHIETDFAQAHAGLGELALASGDIAAADAHFKDAADVMREFWLWFKQDQDISGSTSKEKREPLADFTDGIYTHWQEVLKKEGKETEAAAIATEQRQFDLERRQRLEQEEKSAGGGG